MPSRPREGSSTSSAVAETVQSILASRGLTLYRASQQSIARYGRTSPYFLPHNLYYDLRKGSFRPSVHQIFALSRISGYRVADWLRVFGFDLEDITRLQIQLPSKRTLVLDTSLTDSNEWIPWLRNRPIGEPIPSITPLARLLELGPRRQIASVSQPDQHFIYAKVGVDDAFAFPDLKPGSIVRVNPDVTADLVARQNRGISDRLLLSTARASVVAESVSWMAVSSSLSTMGSLMRRSSCIALRRPGSGARSILSSGRC